MLRGQDREASLTNKIFISLIVSICLPFFSATGNIPVGKPPRKPIQVFRDHKVLSTEAGLMLASNRNSRHSEIGSKEDMRAVRRKSPQQQHGYFLIVVGI